MRTLSIRQPWAWLIVNGHKRVENRDWSTAFRGEFQIHAGLQLTAKEHARISAEVLEHFGIEIPPIEQLVRGGIVGIATLCDCLGPQDMVDMGQSFQRWYTGAQAFILKDARPVPFTPCKGQLGWFDAPRVAGS
jgi:hypothetical protein